MVCGLDIGSNTFSFTQLSRGDRGIYVKEDVSHVVRLSEGLTAGGLLKPQAVARGLAVLERLKADFNLERKSLRAVGTAVLRMAANPEVFTDPAREILGVDVEIISGEQEALLVSRGAIFGLEPQALWIVVDVGGQSTEVCWNDRNGQWHPVSLPIGVVGLTQRHIASDPPSSAEVAALRGEIREVVSNAVPAVIEGTLVGVAGTATTLGMMELGLRAWVRERVHGFDISRDSLLEWVSRILGATTQERTDRFGVRPGRADVFPAGICVMDELMVYLGRDHLTVSANGLRVGVALEMMEERDEA